MILRNRSAVIINTQARSKVYKTLRSEDTEVLELEYTVALAHAVVDAISGIVHVASLSTP